VQGNFVDEAVSNRQEADAPDGEQRGLIERARAGDRAAFTQLVQQCAPRMYALAYRLTGSRADADDLAQEAFLQAYRSLGSFRQECSFATWLYRMTVNLWKNGIRYRMRRLFSRHVSLDGPEAAGMPGLADGAPGPQERLESQADRQAAAQALASLGAQDKVIIVLCDIEQKSYSDIAQILQCPLGTVRSRLSRARSNLRRAFYTITG
jgi:RNA polymerase sigma-70 factor (ECF subfamily)